MSRTSSNQWQPREVTSALPLLHSHIQATSLCMTFSLRCLKLPPVPYLISSLFAQGVGFECSKWEMCFRRTDRKSPRHSGDVTPRAGETVLSGQVQLEGLTRHPYRGVIRKRKVSAITATYWHVREGGQRWPFPRGRYKSTRDMRHRMTAANTARWRMGQLLGE